MKEKQDDAVSAVIAMMLILAIITTCLAVYTTTYVPGLKQQSEITHSEDVRLAFERFASDVNNIIFNMRDTASFTEPLSLGGGDVVLSPMKSGGTLEITDEPVGKLVISKGSEVTKYPVTTAKVTFTPVYTSWEKQGYEYSKGLVWIVKGDKRTPSGMSLLSIDDGINYSKEFTDSIKESIMKSYKETESENASIFLLVMSADSEKNRVTGSGISKLKLSAKTESEDEIPPIQIKSGDILSYEDSDKIMHVIKEFDSDTVLKINKLNITVSAE